MGLLDSIIGGAMRGGMGGMGGGGFGGGLGGGMFGGGMRHGRGGGMGQTLAAGVLLALLVKAARSHTRPQEDRSFDTGGQGRAASTQAGGMGGGLGSILGGGGGLGSILGGLGGAGALGGLIGQMQRKGYGQQVNSWVSTEPNQTLAPAELEDALGEDTIHELEQQTGLPRQQLLADLSRELPEAVNEITPSGQLPDDDELERMAAQPPR
ncbi:YidB family protein [Phenylobacterium sp.]|jgi:uncharacterized protein YidB (DUF937 family)|uniref:YidB family protein n=1 Tax=Phenylobacterium sp. TaxID=1871053 RepID=UPI002F958C2C